MFVIQILFDRLQTNSTWCASSGPRHWRRMHCFFRVASNSVCVEWTRRQKSWQQLAAGPARYPMTSRRSSVLSLPARRTRGLCVHRRRETRTMTKQAARSGCRRTMRAKGSTGRRRRLECLSFHTRSWRPSRGSEFATMLPPLCLTKLTLTLPPCKCPPSHQRAIQFLVLE